MPVGKIQFTLEHTCPYCHQTQTNKTPHDHFLLCNDQKINKTTRIEKVRFILSKLHTPPKIKQIILTNISSYYNNFIETKSPIINNEQYTIEEQPIINKQNAIGWDHFVRCRITSAFHISIKQCYRNNKLGKYLLPLHGIECSLKKS